MSFATGITLLCAAGIAVLAVAFVVGLVNDARRADWSRGLPDARPDPTARVDMLRAVDDGAAHTARRVLRAPTSPTPTSAEEA